MSSIAKAGRLAGKVAIVTGRTALSPAVIRELIELFRWWLGLWCRHS